MLRAARCVTRRHEAGNAARRAPGTWAQGRILCGLAIGRYLLYDGDGNHRGVTGISCRSRGERRIMYWEDTTRRIVPVDRLTVVDARPSAQ